MSTEVTVKDLDSLNASIGHVRSDAHNSTWMLAHHDDGNINVLEVVSEGETLEELYPLLSDTQVMYALIRLQVTVDLSITTKFIYMRWMGKDVSFIKRGRYGVLAGSVSSYFDPYQVNLDTVSSIDELKLDALNQKLEEISGIRNMVIDGSVLGMQERGFTQHTVKTQDRGVAKSVAPSGAEVQVSPELQSALDTVRDNANSTTWVLGSFEEGNLKKPLILVASGNGEIEELKEQLQDDQVMYGYYRTGDQIDDIKTVKFVYIYWIGEKVKPIMKGRVSAYAGPVEQIFFPAHVTFSFTNKQDITAAVINDKVTSSSGSKSFVM